MYWCIYIYSHLQEKVWTNLDLYQGIFVWSYLHFTTCSLSQPFYKIGLKTGTVLCLGIISKEQSLLLAIENSEGFGLQWAFLRFAVQKNITVLNAQESKRKKNTTLKKKSRNQKYISLSEFILIAIAVW